MVSHHDPHFTDLCLLDLPDYDSVEAGHRATVDQVLPRSTSSAGSSTRRSTTTGSCTRTTSCRWPTTPIKPFVANRRDIIGDARQIATLTGDLRRRLEADAIHDRPVFVVSADPPDGQDHGELEELRTWLSERLQAKAVVTERLAADCRQRGAELARQAGLEGEKAPAAGRRRRPPAGPAAGGSRGQLGR